MISYILLIALIMLVLLGIWRASKQKEIANRRPQREPHLGNAQETMQTHASTDEMPHTETIQVKEPAKEPVKELEKETTSVEKEVDITQPEIDFIVIHLFTNAEHPYRGYELLQALLTAGLRYGKKGIFHRHEDMMGRGEILFHLAQAVEPGTFDLPKMGSFTTLGLSFFMITSDVKNALQAFDIMINTAKDIQKELGGELFDGKRRPLSEEKVGWLRSCLRIN